MPILNLPLISQWGISASKYRTDCGVACVAMLLEFYHKRGDWTVDQLAAQTALTARDKGLTCDQLVTLAFLHDLNLYTHPYTTLEQIRREIDAGRPVIALIAYRFILGRLDQRDNNPLNDGHFIVIVGYDDTHFIADDPDYWAPYTERGHNTLIPITELDAAISGGNPYRKCVFSREVIMATSKEIETMKAAEAQIRLALDAMHTYINALVPSDTTPPSPAPLPIVTRYVIASGFANARKGPGTNYEDVGDIPRGTELHVQLVNDWALIVDGTFKGTYVYVPLLSDTRP